MEQHTNQNPRTTTPWLRRQELGFFNALFQTIRETLLRPGQFFDRLSVSNSYKEPFFFYLLISCPVIILASLLQEIIQKKPLVPLTFIVMPIFIALAIFIYAAVTHLGILIVRGKGGYKGTFDVLSYTASATIFNIIPFIGGLISFIWGMVIAIMGFKRVHNIGLVRATIAYFSVLLIALVALLSAIAIPNLLRAKLNANQAMAQASLKTITTATENYKTEKGKYPVDEYDLVYGKPPYLAKTYNTKTLFGYMYSLNFGADNYTFTASPEKCGITGQESFRIDKTGQIAEEPCH